ncbi:hypothetical protein I317_07451 [Kwoniella heveanensis CBS 569]|uniref:Transcription factor CBF/NF-Y/archaeal histone domain-containing protein n=1 Tax=Kwoniella heveanensis BCC8398 TaxID=1296120 RepID=A0A1B9H3F5_9TREE|nr:hypothetical protein I316_00004 [Kwoniella heveanensis BCC8398]OCF38770.1 hypothetical protein I317_07451 [Kwoniella heveanensis CBS 569]
MPALRTKKSKTSRARIKRIMQLDEEVGKLASATPVMISKSLECFMQMLIDETCKETRSRGSKKMTAYHLKAMINTNETFDFLREIVEPIPDPVIAEPKATASTSAAGPSKTRKASNPVPSNSNPHEPKRRASKKQLALEQQSAEYGYGNGYGAAVPPSAHIAGHNYGHAPYYPGGAGAGTGAFDGGRHGHHPVAGSGYGQGQMAAGYGHPHPAGGTTELPAPNKLPSIGTWKSDFTGGGGTGEGGRGIFDDYEEDEDDY